MKRPRHLVVAASTAAVLAAAGVTLGVTTLLAIPFSPEAPEPAAPVYPGAQKAFCVKAVGMDHSVEDEAKDHIENALKDLRENASSLPEAISPAGLVIDTDCSEP